MEHATIFENLRQSRLVTEPDLDALRQRCGDDATTSDMLDSLVAIGKLTSFQAQRLADGQYRGLVLGPYQLQEEVGRGGMGQVYKALHTVMDRVVAIKVIAPELMQQSLAMSWFQREVRAVTKLQHPNVVMAFDANEVDGVHFLVMEFVDGVNLDTLVRQHGPLPVARACELICQAAGALQYAHEQGMVHRDIKPGNLLVSRWCIAEMFEGRSFRPTDTVRATPAVKVVDFGLARLQQGDDAGTLLCRTAGGLVGTPDYIAPEQARSIHAADIRSDLYSLGCTLYFALAGRPPFDGETPVEKALKHITEDAKRLDELRSDVPTEVATLVARLMAKDPANRLQVPADLIRELSPWCGDEAAARPKSVPLAMAGAVADSCGSATRVVDALGLPNDTAAECRAPTQDWLPPPERRLETAPPLRRVKEEPDSEWEVRLPIDRMPDTLVQEHDLGLTRERKTLDRAWQQWTAVVNAIAAGRRAPLSVDRYAAVHRCLLLECAAHAEASTGRQRDLFREIEKLVAPWLSLIALVRTDPSLLLTLQRRCAQSGAALGVSPPWPLWQMAVATVLIGCGILWGTGLLNGLPQALGIRSDWLGDHLSWRTLKDIATTLPGYWVIGSIAFVLAGSLYALLRPPRV